VDWEAPKHPLAAREPRHGRRAALAATLHTPAGPLLVYNLHLEVRLFDAVQQICHMCQNLAGVRCCDVFCKSWGMGQPQNFGIVRHCHLTLLWVQQFARCIKIECRQQG
jgi:hypothetical protein